MLIPKDIVFLIYCYSKNESIYMTHRLRYVQWKSLLFRNDLESKDGIVQR